MSFFKNNSPYIIAEIASAHEGNPDLAIELLNFASKSNADAVKFQIFKTEQLLSIQNPHYKEFKEIELSPDNWEKVLFSFCNKKISLIVEAFDQESLLFAKSLNIFDAYKIPASCLNDHSTYKIYKKMKKPLILGIGGATFNEINNAYDEFNADIKDLVLMCGFQNFPTKTEDVRLCQIKYLKNNFNCDFGYADHIDSENKNLSTMISVFAYGLGAIVFEKHITKNREKKGKDYYSSLNPDEFNEYVKFIKTSKTSYGNSVNWTLTEAEKHYNKFTKKYAVANCNIQKGEQLSNDNIVFKRTNEIGITQDDFKNYIGRKINKEKNSDEMISLEDV